MNNEGKRGIVQFVKFAVVGVSNTAVDWIVYFILTKSVLENVADKPLAKSISFIVAVLNSYIWNSSWTFKKEYSKTTRAGTSKVFLFGRFFVVSLIGWGVNYLVFKFTLSSVSEKDIVGLIFASGAATLWNFFANKFWTYKK